MYFFKSIPTLPYIYIVVKEEVNHNVNLLFHITYIHLINTMQR